MIFAVTAAKVLVMIAYGVPGFLLIKTKTLGEGAVKAFAKMLVYVCQPALTVYSFASVEYSASLAREMLIFFGLTLVAELLIMLVFALIFKKKFGNAAYRIATIAGACGNVGFLGIPLLEKLIPGEPRVVIFSAMFSCTMNLITWTLGLLLMTGDKKFIRPKSIFVNPAMIAFGIGIIIFVCRIKLPDILFSYIETLGRMSTVVCMTVLGMRLALKKLSTVFKSVTVYIAAASKLFVLPVIITLLFLLFPSLPFEVRASAFILACCPAASMILSLSEVHGGDSATASDVILATSILCILTIPLMWTAYCAIFA